MHGFSSALLNDCPLDQTGRDYADRIVKASARMDIMIRDLLAYGRLNSTDLVSAPVNIVPMLEEFARAWEQRNAKIEIEKPMPRVLANSIGLKQILENLLANATKFVASGVTPRVHISAEERGSWVRINIKDNGIGIDPQYHQRIFRIFERLCPKQFPGTGIGLAIVQKGIERMGGKVGLESTPGQGSLFWLELPRA
jgi:signal transduction histidine kinase